MSVFCREELELPSKCKFFLDGLDDSLNTTTEELAGDAASETVVASETEVEITSAMSNCSLSAATP